MTLEPGDFDQRHLDAIADAEQFPYWYEDTDAPDVNPTLVRTENCDLCVVGGGYTGLWTAILAKERDPSRDVVLIDAHAAGSAASGRNGGFMDASLTHGIGNAQARWPDEVEILEELGRRNLNEIEASIKKYDIDCDYERTGVIEVANSTHPPSYLAEVREDYDFLAGSRLRRRVARRRGHAGGGPLAHLHRRTVEQGHVRARRSGTSRVGPQGDRRVVRRAASTKTPRRPGSSETVSE